MKIESAAQAAFLRTDIGQGKRTFYEIVHNKLAQSDQNPGGIRVQTITPSDGNLLTRASWGAMNQLYLATGHPGRLQNFYTNNRAKGSEEGLGSKLIEASNREVHRDLRADIPILTIHGLFGTELPRYFVEGDIPPEYEAVRPQTITFAPHEDTRELIYARGEEMGFKPNVEVTGFLLPDSLLSSERPAHLIDIYRSGAPIRVAFMMTGQTAHEEDLHKNVLGNPEIQQMIRNGQIKLDVYMWNNKKKALRAEAVARTFGLKNTVVTKEYDPNRPESVQIFWNEDPQKAVQTTFAMGEEAALILTPPGERAFWGATTPTILLDPVGNNPKMIGNKEFVHRNKMSGPDSGVRDLAATIRTLRTGSTVEKHFATAHTVFEGRLNGASNIADHMKSLASA